MGLMPRSDLAHTRGHKDGQLIGSPKGSTKGQKLGPSMGTKQESLERKKQSWKSIKHQFIENLETTSTANSVDTSSAVSDSDSHLDPDSDSLVDLSPMEVTLKAFVGLANLTNVQLDHTESTPAMPIDLDSNETPLAHNKSHQDIAPALLITLDSPDNVDEH